MNIESIVKLIQSREETNVRIAYELIIKKWHTFTSANQHLREYNIRVGYRWYRCKRHIKIYTNWPLDQIRDIIYINKNPPTKKK